MPGTSRDEGDREPASDWGEPWRWGIETSRLMGERLIELYQDLGAAGASGLGGDLGGDLRRVRIDMERWVDLSVDVFDRAFTVMRRLAEHGADAHPPVDRLALRGVAGQVVSGDLWVHNVADDERATPTLWCPTLSAASGAEIAGSHVCFELDRRPLTAGTARHVSVVVDVPAAVPPGVYHGQILSDASPASAIALTVVVAAEPAPGDA